MKKIINLGTLISCLFYSNQANAQVKQKVNTDNGFSMHGKLRMGNAHMGIDGHRIMTKTIPHDQVIMETTFFGGDTLQNFDYTGVLNSALPKFPIYSELRAYMFLKEKNYVIGKYYPGKEKLELNRNLLIKPASPFANEAARNGGNNQAYASSCNNVDFELGDFTGWLGNSGYNANSAAFMTITGPPYTAGTNASIYACGADVTIVTAAAAADPY